MDRYNLQALTPQQWLGILAQVGSRETPVVIYTNKQRDVALFSTSADAKSEGYKPLSEKEIIKITDEMLQSGEIPPNFEAARGLSWIAHKTFEHAEDKRGSLPLIGGLQAARLEQQARATLEASNRIRPAEGAPAEQLQELDNVLNGLESVDRSIKGANGVYFFRLPDATCQVIKPITDPGAILAAERLYEAFGFETAHTFALPRREARPLQISGALSERVSDEYRTQAEGQLASSSHFLIMDFIPSTALSDLPADDLIEILNDSTLCKEIGRMIFLDMAINNWDRLNYQAANTGNLMIPDEPDADARRPIALIDHQMNLTRETQPIVQQRLEQLINRNGCEDIARAMIGKLLMKYPEALEQVDVNNVAAAIREGVLQGQGQFIERYSNEKARFDLFDTPEIRQSPAANLKVFSEVVNYTRHLGEQ